MVRVLKGLILSTVIACSAAFAAPASRPAASKPSADQLRLTAIELMRAQQFARASIIIDQAYRATKPDELTRPLILNRAMLDVKQRINNMRAVKEMRDYLRLNPVPDDEATNILGAALQQVPQDPRVRQGELFKSAEHELEQAVARLQQLSGTDVKWGSRWYNAKDFEPLREKREDAMTRVTIETKALDRATAARDAAEAKLKQFNAIELTPHIHRDRFDGPSATCFLCIAQRQHALETKQATAEAMQARAAYQDQQHRTDAALQAVPKPQWALTFDPIDPGELTAPAPVFSAPGQAAPPLQAAPAAAPPPSNDNLR